MGSSPTGEVFEQRVSITHENKCITCRRIVVKLAEPTRHGDTEVAVFSNLPQVTVSASLKGDKAVQSQM